MFLEFHTMNSSCYNFHLDLDSLGPRTYDQDFGWTGKELNLPKNTQSPS